MYKDLNTGMIATLEEHVAEMVSNGYGWDYESYVTDFLVEVKFVDGEWIEVI